MWRSMAWVLIAWACLIVSFNVDSAHEQIKERRTAAYSLIARIQGGNWISRKWTKIWFREQSGALATSIQHSSSRRAQNNYGVLLWRCRTRKVQLVHMRFCLPCCAPWNCERVWSASNESCLFLVEEAEDSVYTTSTGSYFIGLLRTIRKLWSSMTMSIGRRGV